MPYGTPLTTAERTARHKLIYGDEPPSNRRTQYQVTNIGTGSENIDLIMIAGGIGAVYIFVEFILPHIWKK